MAFMAATSRTRVSLGQELTATRSAHHSAGPRPIVAHPQSSHTPGLLALTLRKECLQLLTTPRADGDLTAIRSDRDLGSGGTARFDMALTRGCRVSPVISTPYTRHVLLPADKMIREPLDRLDRLAGELAGRANTPSKRLSREGPCSEGGTGLLPKWQPLINRLRQAATHPEA